MLPFLPPPEHVRAAPRASVVAAWIVYWNPESVARFEAQAAKLDEAMPEAYTIEKDGTASRRPRTEEAHARLLAAAEKAGTRLYGMASNFAAPVEGEASGFGPDRAHLMLNEKTKMRAYAASLARMAREDGYGGVDLDFESMLPADRDAYSAFVRELAALLHREGRKLSVTVHAKTGPDAEGGWDAPKAQDYAALGKAADSVRIMAYDFSWSGSAPGPIAPDDWVRKVGRYARSVIAPEKVSLGVPAYGYDWGAKPATSLRWSDLAAGDRAEDPPSGELLVGAARFAGAASVARKLRIARDLGLGGISIWYCGSEDPAMWDALPDRR